MLEKLKNEVYEANMLLPKHKLVTFTWGNVSGIDRNAGLIAIKPSGVEYDALKPENIVLVDLDGKVIEGELNPSSDTATHIALYKAFTDIKGIVHTHSPWAVIFAQAGLPITAAGTTHADYFYGDIPVTRQMHKDEIAQNYEAETGQVIIETFEENHIKPLEMPGVLVNDHGPFTWGNSAIQAVENAVVLEEVAKMAYYTQQLSQSNILMNEDLLNKHYLRKHGKNAYYGQANKEVN